MKVLKIVLIVLLVYVGIVALFETLLGTVQPRPEGSIVLATTDDEGEPHERVVSALPVEGELYVAVNHWPRAWYGYVLERPKIEVTRDGETKPYRAVPVKGEEYERVIEEHPRSFVFKLLTGFPPRRILRLEPREPGEAQRGSEGA